MNGPKHLCVDQDDSVLIADAENHLIRRYVPTTGKILRVAGNGRKGTAGLGGPPAQSELNRPHGVTVHRDGTLYITDSYNTRVLKIVRGARRAGKPRRRGINPSQTTVDPHPVTRSAMRDTSSAPSWERGRPRPPAGRNSSRSEFRLNASSSAPCARVR